MHDEILYNNIVEATEKELARAFLRVSDTEKTHHHHTPKTCKDHEAAASIPFRHKLVFLFLFRSL